MEHGDFRLCGTLGLIQHNGHDQLFSFIGSHLTLLVISGDHPWNSSGRILGHRVATELGLC